MKIIFCLHHFLPEYSAGTEIYVLSLAQYLKRNGTEVVVVIPNYGQGLSCEYTYEGVRVVRYAETGIESRKVILGEQEPNGLEVFCGILAAEKPDIVHFHEIAPGSGINKFHVVRTQALRIPIIITFHVSTNTCLRGTLIYRDHTKCDGVIDTNRCTKCYFESKNLGILKSNVIWRTAQLFFSLQLNTTKLNSSIGTALGFPFIVKEIKSNILELSLLATRFIVLSNWYKKVLEANGVEPSKVSFIKQGLTSNPKVVADQCEVTLPLRVVFFGRISKLKGLHLLIDAVCRLSKADISLFIYGRSNDCEYSELCMQSSSMNENIHWMGEIPSEKVVATMSKYHLLCLPSTFSEMSPLVIQEAFAAGLPVIASDVYGNSEQIMEGINGWLFKYKDSYHLTAKLRLLIERPELVERARRKLPSVRFFDEIAKEHMKVYSSVHS